MPIIEIGLSITYKYCSYLWSFNSHPTQISGPSLSTSPLVKDFILGSSIFICHYCREGMERAKAKAVWFGQYEEDGEKNLELSIYEEGEENLEHSIYGEDGDGDGHEEGELLQTEFSALTAHRNIRIYRS